MYINICVFILSVTKSAFLLSLMLAYNHTHSLLDPAPLVLLGGCVLVGVKLWSLQVRTVDPFVSPQGKVWQALTCLSVQHPHRDVGSATGKRCGNEGTKERGRGSTGGQEKVGEEDKDKATSEQKADLKPNDVEHLKRD